MGPQCLVAERADGLRVRRYEEDRLRTVPLDQREQSFGAQRGSITTVPPVNTGA